MLARCHSYLFCLECTCECACTLFQVNEASMQTMSSQSVELFEQEELCESHLSACATSQSVESFIRKDNVSPGYSIDTIHYKT